MRLAGIEAERTAVRDMFRSGAINDHTARSLFTEITLTEALLQGRQERKLRPAVRSGAIRPANFAPQTWRGQNNCVNGAAMRVAQNRAAVLGQRYA
ncbi:hypothetical protein [Mesorhizobium caraganae]|uniref:hypothetical protein n=1 Tax=Mesorhizobium caraganae TaxID=483206 RepID=UPI003ECCF906